MELLLQPIVAPQRPFVKFIEQPSSKLRYRYKCEGRPSTIPGTSSSRHTKTPIVIQIVGYQGRVVVLVSCVTKEQPYRPHPHNLVGQNCKHGVCSIETEITPNNSTITFPKVAMLCVKIRDVKESLKVREEKNVDPFNTGFTDDVKLLDLGVVRLCVQVILVNENRERTAMLTPIVSDPIVNTKTFSDPVIYRLSHCNSYVDGRDDDIILLCNKITKENIRIRFAETQNGEVVWEDFGTFHPKDVYNQSAICFRPPKYHNQNILVPVKVEIQLVRSDGVVSPPCEFEYLPLDAKPGVLKEKRKKCGNPFFAQLVNSVCPTWSQDSVPPAKKMAWMGDSDFPVLEENLLNNDMSQVNDISQATPSTSRRSTQEDIATWNITDDFGVGTNIDVDSASGIKRIFNMDLNQVELEPIHISSGDLEMTDVNKLSGSLCELAL